MNILNKIEQLAILHDETRFKILLALFNSDIKIHGTKLGSHSCTLSELVEILEVNESAIKYNLDLMSEAKLLEKKENYYHISLEGKEFIKRFGIDDKLVKKVAETT